jgi:hypothetical protein
MILSVNPLIAVGVLASTAATDAAYVFFNAAVTGRRRIWAANWSAIWYLLSAFAVISYTEKALSRSGFYLSIGRGALCPRVYISMP